MTCRPWWSARWKPEWVAARGGATSSWKVTCPAMSGNRFGEFQEIRVLLGLACKILPGGVARERLPFLDVLGRQVVDLRALGRVGLHKLLVVVLRGLEGEVLKLQADLGHGLLLLRRQRLKGRFRHQERFEDEPERLAAARGQVLGQLVEAEGNQAG